MKKPLRKSSIYTIKGGYTYYQTYSFYGSTDGLKKKIQKSLGKGKSKTQLTNDKKEWDLYFNEVDKNYLSRNPFTKPPQPLTEICKRWIEENEKMFEIGDISKSTLRFNRENTNLFLRWYLSEYGNKQIHRITTKEIDEYRTYRRRLGLSDNTISINLRSVRTFLKWCVKQSYIETSPFTSDINIPSYKRRTDEEIPMGDDWKKLYGFIEKSIYYQPKGTKGEFKFDKFNENDWFKYVIYIMCNNGMRGGEVRILKWKKGKRDTTSQRNSYSYLNKDFSKIHIFFKGSYGEIPTTKKLKRLFKELSNTKGSNTYVFQSPITNEPYDKSIFNKMFRELMVNLKLVDDDDKPKYSPHSIRHSVVSDLIQKGEQMYNIQKLLRHSSIRTTMDIYSHLLPSDLEKTMEKIGG
jgi:integrase